MSVFPANNTEREIKGQIKGKLMSQNRPYNHN